MPRGSVRVGFEMSTPPVRSARKTRDVFACCSRRATQTHSVAGDDQTDPLSPIKPEEAAGATELGVGATAAEASDATMWSEQKETFGARAERAGSERHDDDGVSVVGIFAKESLLGADAMSSSPSLEDEDDDDARAVAAGLAASLSEEEAEDAAAAGLDAASDVSASRGDVSSGERFERAPSRQTSVPEVPEAVPEVPEAVPEAVPETDVARTTTFETGRVAGLAVADETTPLFARGARADASTDADAVAESSAVSSASEDEKALVRGARGDDSKRRRSCGGVGRFGSVRNASAKSVVLAATTFAVCAACAASVLTLRFAAPRATAVVGPDAKALAASEAPKKEAHPTEKRRGARAARASSPSSARKTRARASPEKAAAPRTAHAAADDDNDTSTLGTFWERSERGTVMEKCASTLGEARHGVHAQPSMGLDSSGASERASASCRKCYLKGTPAETQRGSMEWCRASVCERHGVEGCAPPEADASSTGRAAPRAARRDERRGGKPTRRHGPSFSAAREARLDGVDGSVAVSGTARDGSAERARSDEPTVADADAAAVAARRVGRCRAGQGDADFGRYVWEDPSCKTRAKQSGAGCLEQGTHHCRLCSVEVRDEARRDEEGGIATCPRDVCDVHNLFWELCDES